MAAAASSTAGFDCLAGRVAERDNGGDEPGGRNVGRELSGFLPAPDQPLEPFEDRLVKVVVFLGGRGGGCVEEQRVALEHTPAVVQHPEESRRGRALVEVGSVHRAIILDRYHTRDLVWHNDGHHLDRESLIAHARPVRRTVTECRIDIHETLVSGDRAAARYTVEAVRRGRVIVIEIYMFGQLAQDGRLRRVDQVTRTLTED